MRRLRIFLAATGITFGVLSLCAVMTTVLLVIIDQYGPVAGIAFLIACLSIAVGAVLAAAP